MEENKLLTPSKESDILLGITRDSVFGGTIGVTQTLLELGSLILFSTIMYGAVAGILIGLGRDSVLKIAESIGITVEERLVHREELLTADELFFSGTAALIAYAVIVL